LFLIVRIFKKIIMKTIIKITTLLVLATMAFHGKAQNTVINICAGSTTVLTAINSLSLSSPSYSLEPGGITSITPFFTIVPTFPNYTLYVTGTNSSSAVVTTSSTVMVITNFAPTYSLNSSGGYSLICGLNTGCPVTILSPNTIPAGGVVGAAFLAPGSSTIVPNSAFVNTILSNSILANVPGTWSVVLQDIVNLCRVWDTFNITMNNAVPLIAGDISATQNTLTCNTPSIVLSCISNYSLNYFWSSNTFTSSSQSVTVTSPSTLITLQVVEPATGCSETQTTSIFQNIVIPTASVNPLTQSVICGPGVVATATGTAINPTLNVTHLWFSPNAPVPATSSGPFSVFNPVVGTTTYIVTDNVNGCSSNPMLVNVTSLSGFPTFSVNSILSANAFTLGCSTKSITDITIVNLNTTPAGGAVSFTILPPSFTGSTYTYNTVTTQTFNVSGNYTVIVRDNGNSCETRITVPLIQNLTPPNILVSALTQTLTCFIPSVTLEGSSTNPASYNWSFQNGSNLNNISNPIITVTNNPSQTALTQSIINTYTLTVTDQNNLCTSNTVITMMQNVRPPIPIINGTGTLTCLTTTFTLANGSNIDPAPGFYSPLGTQATLWQGPTPQIDLINASFYEAYTSGTYSMTVMDLNNGCVSMTAVNIDYGPKAAFSHTIAGGLAVFSNETTGTIGSTPYVWFWDFGDGYTSFMQNPTHTYINGGAHLVKLKLTDPIYLCSDSVIQSVNVSGVPCSANSNFSVVPTSTAQVWNVVPSYPWNVAAASWSWGDGSVSNTLYTSHQYSTAGMYNICLTVTVSCAATSSTCTSYSVYKVSQEAMIIAVNVVAPELISGITSLASNEQLSWDILPNPNSGEFNLNLNKTLSEPTRVVISDLTGRVLHEQFVQPDLTSTSVNTGKLPSGLYLVTIESNGLRATKRMIVNR
jgi:PKD repeat protein